LKPVT